MDRLRTVVCALSVLGGCSFARVRVPDRPQPGAESSCPTAAHWLDTVGAVFTLGLATAGAFSENTGESRDAPVSGQLVAIPFAAGGLVYVASAVYGHRAASRCRRLARIESEHERAAADALEAETRALAKAAVQHARDGDCSRALALLAEVEGRVFHIHAFVISDPAIERCMARRAAPEVEPRAPIEVAPGGSTP